MARRARQGVSGPLPRVQGLQGRVPRADGHRNLQGRVPLPLLRGTLEARKRLCDGPDPLVVEARLSRAGPGELLYPDSAFKRRGEGGGHRSARALDTRLRPEDVQAVVPRAGTAEPEQAARDPVA